MAETAITSGGIAYTEDQLLYLANEVKDYQVAHGSMLKLVSYETETSVPAKPIGTSVLPTAFLRKHFDEAMALQEIFNELYILVASNPDWLYGVLEPLIKHDSLLAALWEIYTKIRDAGVAQSVVCGVFRSDYMLHQPSAHPGETELKQVEINTFYAAGACHAERIANMHQHLGVVRGLSQDEISRGLPKNQNTQSIVALLKAAHDNYASRFSKKEGRSKCVLMTVEPANFNTADERPIQYGLWDVNIPCYRCEWQTILEMTTLTEDRTLLFHPPVGKAPLEVSVLYYRAAFDARDYDEQGKDTRLRLEMGRAIKCPDILTQLTNMKSVQQALSLPGALEHFLQPESCEKIRKTFMPMQCLDSSPEGLRARSIAQDPEQAVNYVLKPNRDGGGHNVYRSDIPSFLSKEPQEKWQNYILMRLIEPPPTVGALMMPEDLHIGNVVSELGILGTCLWRRAESWERSNGVDVLRNEVGGFTFKTKPEDVDEMSVVKGYGCFDCPLLVD